MNKKAIWVIIGLMSAALVGIILLQVYWINWSYQLSENQFSKDVFAALNRVADKLHQIERIEEDIEVFSLTESGVSSVDTGESNVGEAVEASLSQRTLNIDSLEKQRQAIIDRMNDQQKNFPETEEERDEKYRRQEALRHRLKWMKNMNPGAISERIDLNILDDAIRNELRNRNIGLDYTYGVFSRHENSFVIKNGHYVVPESNPQVFSSDWKNLYNSNYRVDLYTIDDLKSPGMLMIHFPGKVGLFWGQLWKVLLSSIIFTGLILFCFAYTIQVIFFQKKVSEMKTDFINNMTHEFKTPIATISLAADSITSPIILGNQDKVKRFANIIKQENKRMNSQVEKVLQMATLDKQEFDLKLAEINVHDVITLAVNNVSLQVEQKSGTVQTIFFKINQASYPGRFDPCD